MTTLTDEQYRLARKRLEEYDARVADGERITNESTLKVAEEMARLFDDGRWYDEVVAERESRPQGRGRPVERTRSAFSGWIVNDYPNIKRRRTYQLIGAHETVVNYVHSVHGIRPTSEAQVRPLYRLTKSGRGDLIPEVWAIAVENAVGSQPTQPEVAKAVRDWWAENVPKSVARREATQAKWKKKADRIRQEFHELLLDEQYGVAQQTLNSLLQEFKAQAKREAKAS